MCELIFAQPFRWTDENVETLKRLWPVYKASQIAVFMGAPSRNAICGKASRLKLVKPERVKSMSASARSHRRRKFAPASAKPSAPTGPPQFPKAKPPRPVIPAGPHRPGTIRLADLREHHCRWIDGETFPLAMFCGETKIEGSSYCAAHKARTVRASER